MNLKHVVTMFLALGILVLLVQSWREASSLDPEEHERLTTAITRAKQIDATLDRLVLETRTGTLGRHDELIATLRAGEDAIRDLSGEFAPTSQLRRELNHGIKRSVALWREKSDRIEEFKTANAALGNSLRYFPQALEHYLNHPSESDDPEAMRAALDAVRTTFHHEDRDRAEVLERLAAIDPGRTAKTPPGNILLIRAQKLAEETRRTEARMKDVTAVPVIKALDDVERLAQTSFRASAAKAFGHRLGLTVMATLLFIYGFLSVLNLRLTTRELNDANEMLEIDRMAQENEIERLREELGALRDRVERSGRVHLDDATAELVELADRAGHDLDEPVRELVSCAAALCRNGELEAETAANFRGLAESAARVRDAMRLMREVERTFSSEAPTGPVDLATTLAEVTGAMATRLELAGASLSPPEESGAVLGHPVLLAETLRTILGAGLAGDAPRIGIVLREEGEVTEIDVLAATLGPGCGHLPVELLRDAAEALGGAIGIEPGQVTLILSRAAVGACSPRPTAV
ncbi:MAG: DAHL domain-containing protein [Planctomycetota bacterium]